MYLIYGIALRHTNKIRKFYLMIPVAVTMLIRDFGDGRSWAPALRQQGYEISTLYLARHFTHGV